MFEKLLCQEESLLVDFHRRNCHEWKALMSAHRYASLDGGVILPSLAILTSEVLQEEGKYRGRVKFAFEPICSSMELI